jgi:mono/diheme cytochrome c family protein
MRRATFTVSAVAAGLAWLAGSAGPLAAQPAPDLGTDEQIQAGKVVYDKYCAQCHGEDGAGQGIAAPRLHPEPRDFTSGKYKIRSTPTGYLPTDEDIRRSIRQGLPYTGMPAFRQLSEQQVTNVIYFLKSLAPDFEDPAAYAEPVEIPEPPPFSEDSLEVGFETYVEIGCARCHGDRGRGDGRSAPTLRDDWGRFIRPADLSMPWTFRGGATREDIFRSISTGLAGTPMAGFADGLTVEQRWQIVDWIVAQADGHTEAPYSDLVKAVAASEDLAALDEAPSIEQARELFADAPAALFPVVGQIMEPGRELQPSAVAVEVRAVYDPDEVAFLVTWHDIVADTSGENGPDLEVPPFEEQTDPLAAPAAEVEETREPAGGGGDFWGTGGGDAAAADESEEPESGGGGDFWGAGGGDTAQPADPFGQSASAAEPGPAESPWSDAVAVQLPIELREGIAKPYFLFGDPEYPVELWFADLARSPGAEGALYDGLGSDNVTPSDGAAPTVVSGYSEGEWAVVFKRDRFPTRGVQFAEQSFVPVAFSVWDGFYHERGSRRGLTSWHSVYVEPMEDPEVLAPMAKAGVAVLGLELLLIALVRRKYSS